MYAFRSTYRRLTCQTDGRDGEGTVYYSAYLYLTLPYLTLPYT